MRCGLADNRSDQRPEQGGDQGGDGRRDGRISSQEAARRAMDFLEEIAGTPPEMVTAVVPADDDGWHVSVEMLELARIPDSSDILGCYEVTLDPAGEPVSYRRTRRYVRTQTGEE